MGKLNVETVSKLKSKVTINIDTFKKCPPGTLVKETGTGIILLRVGSHHSKDDSRILAISLGKHSWEDEFVIHDFNGLSSYTFEVLQDATLNIEIEK